MIFDSIDNIALYKGMHPGLDVAIDDILSRSFSTERAEPLQLEGGVFFTTARVQLKDRDKSRWECHDLYIDLQYVVSGDAETIEYAPRSLLTGWEKKEGADIYFSDDAPYRLPLELAGGYFAVFFPGDAHRPAQGAQGKHSLKTVYKIPV